MRKFISETIGIVLRWTLAPSMPAQTATGGVMFDLMSRYFWAICIAVALAKYLAMRRRIRALTDLSPTEKQSGEACAQWFAILSCLPWLIMGWGILGGGVPSVFAFLRPADRNPYVILWLGTIFVLTLVYAGWVWFAGGARKVQAFQLYNANLGSRRAPLSETAIKIFAALGPFFVLFWIWWMARLNIPAQPLR